MPDYAKAKLAINSLFRLFDRIPVIDNWASSANKQLSDFKGNISFDSITFSYPTRKNQKVLNGFTLDVPHSKQIALVGSSGCGKYQMAIAIAIKYLIMYYN